MSSPLHIDIPPAIVNAIAERAAELAVEQMIEAGIDANRQEWFTIEKAALYLDMPLGTLRERARDRRLPVYPDGRRLFFKRADLDAYREHLREEAVAAPVRRAA